MVVRVGLVGAGPADSVFDHPAALGQVCVEVEVSGEAFAGDVCGGHEREAGQ